MSQTLGQRIRQARKASGMTQDQLAQAIPVSRQTVSSWENDRTQPDFETLQKLAGMIGMSDLLQTGMRVEETTVEAEVECTDETAAIAEKKAKPLRWLFPALLAMLLLSGVVYCIWRISPKVNAPSLEWFMTSQQPAPNACFLELSTSTTPVMAYSYPADTPPRWAFRVFMMETGGVDLTIQQISQTFFSHEWFGRTVAARREYVHPWLIQQDLGGQTMAAGDIRALGLNLQGDKHTAGVGIAVETIDANGNMQVFHTYIPFENP